MKSLAKNSALLWQKEATDKSPKCEKVVFLDLTEHILLPIPSLEQKRSILLKDI